MPVAAKESIATRPAPHASGQRSTPGFGLPAADRRWAALAADIAASPGPAAQLRPAGPAPGLPAGSRGTPTGLPDRLRQGAEALSGQSLADVRVHYGSPKPAEVSALAYTQGREIHVAPGQERHLPHEVWHAVQQKQGRVRSTTAVHGHPVNDDSALEHEADRMGERALQTRTGDGAKTVQAPTPAGQGSAEVCQGKHGKNESEKKRDATYKDGRFHPFKRVDLTQNEETDGGSKHGKDSVVIDLTQDDETDGGGEHQEDDSSCNMPEFLDKKKAEDVINWERLGAALNKTDENPKQRLQPSNSESGPKDYYTENHGKFEGVSYWRDGVGSIDFGKAHKIGSCSVPNTKERWCDPVKPGSSIDLTDGVKGQKKAEGYGATGINIDGSAEVTKIKGASRAQHFKMANLLAKNGCGDRSPNKLTWHHMRAEYQMVLVDRAVHKKHAHNGGFSVWR
jgi:hypothetical protein